MFFYIITIAYPLPDQKLEYWYLFCTFIDKKHWLLQNYFVFWELWLSQSFVKIHQSNFTLQACLNNNVLVSLSIHSYKKWPTVANILWIKTLKNEKHCWYSPLSKDLSVILNKKWINRTFYRENFCLFLISVSGPNKRVSMHFLPKIYCRPETAIRIPRRQLGSREYNNKRYQKD